MAKRIALMACKWVKQQNICTADAMILVALMRRKGEFERYKEVNEFIEGIIGWEDCKGKRTLLQFASLKGFLAGLGGISDVIRTGTCVSAFCRHKDELMSYIKSKVKIEIVDCGHRYAPHSNISLIYL